MLAPRFVGPRNVAPRFAAAPFRHRGASDRLIRRARQVLDIDEVLELADPTIRYQTSGLIPTVPLEQDASQNPASAIRDLLADYGTSYQDAVIAMWTYLYAGGPPPVGALSTQAAAETWRNWFDANGLQPAGLTGTRDYVSPSPYALRPAESYRTPVEAIRPAEQPTTADLAIGDYQARQSAAVEAWRAMQLASIRALWQDGFQEGAQNFAEQYPELATDDLLAELDAEDATDDELSPHYNSVAKMVGELTNLLMLAPAVPQIQEWFDRHEHRVQTQAETMAWQAEQRGYREAGANMGLLIEWESENDAATCDDCAAFADASPYTDEGGDNPLPAYPGDGTSQCGPNCRCSLNYLEPDTTGLAEAPAGDETDAGDFAQFSADAVAEALGVDSMAELDGLSLADTLDTIGTRTRNLDVEVGFAVGPKGDILASALGDGDSVGFSTAQLKQSEGAAVSIHNHPAGTAFSPTDVAFAFTQRFGAMRVVSPSWDYVIKPVSRARFDPADAKAVISVAQKHAEDLYPAVAERAHQIFGAGGTTFEAAFKQASVNFWHDIWTATAKETGLFTYERTPAAKLEQMVHVAPQHVTAAQIHEENLKALGQLPADFPKTEQDILAMQTFTGPSGANAGTWKRDFAGHEYYVKPMNLDHAANEVGSMRAYELFGAVPGQDIPYVSIIKRVDDQPLVVSRKVETAIAKTPLWWESPNALGARMDAQKLWPMDALLSHFDVVGANPAKGFDNLLARQVSKTYVEPTGAFRVEGGGAMAFGGLGNLKVGWKVGGEWVEPWTMRGINHGGVLGGPTVKPVFGEMTDKKAAELLGKLKGLDVDTLAKAWSDLGMKSSAIIDNLAVINYRLSQIDAVQTALGFNAVSPVVAEVKAPVAIASQITYKPWNVKTDRWAKGLIVQLKPFFEDFKQFSPVAGKVSSIVEQLTTGLVVPASVKAKPDLYARTLRRVAFGRSYNMALAGKFDQMPPQLVGFWKSKLGLEPQVELKIGKVIDVGKETQFVTTALPHVSPDEAASVIAFGAAHPDWWAAWEKAEPWKKEGPTGLTFKSGPEAFAASYQAYTSNSEWQKEVAPDLHNFWQRLLGSLPGQPEQVKPIAQIAGAEQAVKAAAAGPYDKLVSDLKDEITKTGESEDGLASVGQIYVKDQLDPNEMISALVKFNIAGSDESAANIIAEWMAKYQEPVEGGPVWVKPDLDAFAQFQADAVQGVGATTFADFQATYADWLAGGNQASWMPTPVTKWFDANMVKVEPPSSVPIPAAEHPSGPAWEDLKTAEGTWGTNYLDEIWDWLYAGGPYPTEWAPGQESLMIQAWTKHFIDKGFDPAYPPAPTIVAPTHTPEILPTDQIITTAQLDQLYGLLQSDWPAIANTVTKLDFAKTIADYQEGKSSESWSTWFQQHAPEIAAIQGPEADVIAPGSATSFTAIPKTLLAWSPKSDKWGKKFSASHPKFYESFRSAFKAKAWVQTITPELQFPPHWIEQRKTRLRLKVALARTYNMAIAGKYAELDALDPKLSLWWKAKLGDLAPTAPLKAVAAIQADLASLQRAKEELRVSHPQWYADFRTTFGHSVTLKIVPELSTVELPIPAQGTKERELRSLAFAKSYLMAVAGDVNGLKAIDENLLYFWDEKLGGGLAPKIVVSLEGAPWAEDLNALYGKTQSSASVDTKYARSTRATDYNTFVRAVRDWTDGRWSEIRQAAKNVLRGGAGGRYAKEAKALIEALQDAPNNAPQLTRRESWGSVATRAGTTREQLPEFFRAKIGTDYTFSMDIVSTQYVDRWGGDMKWVIEPGSQSFYAQPHSVHAHENEYISAGRFQITRVDQVGGELIVHVKQVGVFDLPE